MAVTSTTTELAHFQVSKKQITGLKSHSKSHAAINLMTWIANYMVKGPDKIQRDQKFKDVEIINAR
jgi:hypothetical protein